MTADLIIDYETHLQCKRVWRVDITIPLDGSPEGVRPFLDVTVDVISPDKDLAWYIAARMFPSYTSICVPDEPLH